jgi:hypothetical protein
VHVERVRAACRVGEQRGLVVAAVVLLEETVQINLLERCRRERELAAGREDAVEVTEHLGEQVRVEVLDRVGHVDPLEGARLQLPEPPLKVDHAVGMADGARHDHAVDDAVRAARRGDAVHIQPAVEVVHAAREM